MSSRILWLTENYPPQRGGMAQSCDRIVDHMRKLGFMIDVLHFTATDSTFQFTQQLNGWYAAIPFEESESHTLNRTWEFIRHKKVSAVVSFGGYLPMLGAPVFSKWLDIPLLTMIRGNDFDSSIFTPRKRDMMRDALEASKIVSTVSRNKKEKIRKLYPDVNVRYAPNGIDTKLWQPSASEKDFAVRWKQENSKERICIGLFGQLKAKKGVRFLFESLQGSPMLNDLHFLLIGELTEEVNTLLTDNSISFTQLDFLDRYELLKYYLCCDALAIPSFYDGMPNVLLEAGALGIPVLASDVDGMQDVIRDQQNGLLFTPGDHESCRKKFFDFIGLPNEVRINLGANLKSTITSEYNVELETNAYDTLFKELLGSTDSAIRLHAH